MRNIRFGDKYDGKIALALGFFDCMHKGHRVLLNCAEQMAKQYGCQTALLTFENNFSGMFGKNTKLVYTFSERKNILSNLKLDVLFSRVFDEDFMRMSSSDFLSVLDGYDIVGIVCGFDYTFGRDRASSDVLEQYCKQKHIDFVSVQPVLNNNGEKISTTLIKNCLSNNDLRQANEYLVDDYFISGQVVSGRKVGSKIGFPTANVEISADKYTPLGVYSGYSYISGKKYNAIVNLGSLPTYGIDKFSPEAHFIGFDGDLYGKQLKVSLTKYLRPTKQFASQDELISQLNIDEKEAQND